jgi:pre-mRNA-processing factor 6
VLGAQAVCQAIVRNTIGVGVDEQDQRNTWMNDAEIFLGRGSIETARATYQHTLTVFRGKESIWLKAAQLEKKHGTKDVSVWPIGTRTCRGLTRHTHTRAKTLENLLKDAVKYCPQSETLWLMLAKEKSLRGDIGGARTVGGCARALRLLP